MFSYINFISLTATNEHYMVAGGTPCSTAASASPLERRQVNEGSDRVVLPLSFSTRIQQQITNCDLLVLLAVINHCAEYGEA